MIQFLACKKKKRGFTLIELLVVIAIIGILAGIVLVSLNSARVKARDAKRQSDLHQIALAMEMCYDDATCSGTAGSYLNVTLTTGPTAIGTYMPVVPTTAGGGTAYAWVVNTATRSKYLACAALESGGVGYVYSTQNGTKTVATGACPTTLVD
ncbi:MAG: type II secretion system protein [bacterium]